MHRLANFLNPQEIDRALNHAKTSSTAEFRAVVDKARALARLTLEEVAILMAPQGDLREELFSAAHDVKQAIYGPRVVLFAPLYLSNLCSNECTYCAFRKTNTALERRWLQSDEIAEQTRLLTSKGYKRLLLVSGEAYPKRGFSYIIEAIANIYATKSGHGEIRRVHVNLAPPTVEQFYQLREARIGVYQCFQESYHRPTYAAVHPSGKKADFDWRATVMHRAMSSGIEDVGMGVLYGLYDWKWETLALLQHIRELEREFGAGSHTISVPRLEPAFGSETAARPPHAVNDDDFLKLIAVLRLAVPYSGLVMSTRESAAIRRKSLGIGVSQISAGSRTDPGGYAATSASKTGQFEIGDERSLAEVVREILELGLIPSFCTACYRLGRIGADFKNLASHANVMARNCDTNALTTLLEYLCDYSPDALGERVIEQQLARMAPPQQAFTRNLLGRIRNGERDLFI